MSKTQARLIEECQKTTMTTLLLGDLRKARDHYHRGVGSPYFLQDSFHLFFAAIITACSMPGILLSLLLEGLRCLSYKRDKEHSFMVLTKSLHTLLLAIKYLILGILRGLIKTTILLPIDLFRWMKSFLILLYLSLHPEYKKQALLFIDFQNDFFEEGPLSIQGASKAFSVAQWIAQQKNHDVKLIASQDWHPGKRELPEDPEKHGSFASEHQVPPFSKVQLCGLEQIAWPEHCIQGTRGAELKSLCISPDVVIKKGENPFIDSYSAFYDNNHTRATKLQSHLQALHVDTLVIAGLATDYCVLYSAQDALRSGYDVIVITDAIAAIDPIDGVKKTKSILESTADSLGKSLQFCSAKEWIQKEQSRNTMPLFLS